MTVGFFRRLYDRGIRDLTSVRLTGRHVLGSEFMIDHANYTDTHFARGGEKVLFEILDYKTNATNSNITLIAGEQNFPVMTEDNYGRGRFFILNVPENFADLYKLPAEVIRGMNKHLSMGQRVYLGCAPKFSLFAYDNNVYGVHSFRPMADTCQIVVRGECKGLRDLETGELFANRLALALPHMKGDATTVIEEPAEFAFHVKMGAGTFRFFELVE